MNKLLRLHVTGHVILGKITQDRHGKHHIREPRKVQRTFTGVLK